ncbi:MAG: NAD-dependent epimerase/dehydratase family protein [Polymorphobacter sp.]
MLGRAALPADDDTPVAPINVYGASKAAAEALVLQSGITAAVVRFSTVYGGDNDHHDRVIPAFIGAARAGQPLRVNGADVMVDATHVDDVAAALARLAQRLAAGDEPAGPLLLASGIGTTLLALAQRACALTGSTSAITVHPPREYDVERFIGTSARTAAFLGWQPAITLDAGLARLAAPCAP